MQGAPMQQWAIFCSVSACFKWIGLLCASHWIYQHNKIKKNIEAIDGQYLSSRLTVLGPYTVKCQVNKGEERFLLFPQKYGLLTVYSPMLAGVLLLIWSQIQAVR